MTSWFANNPDEPDEDDLAGEFTDDGLELTWHGEITLLGSEAIDYEGAAFIE
jgi:hypothetical protein